MFKHQLACAWIRVNAEPVYGKILELSARFVSDNYFRKGNFNLRSGIVSDIRAYTTGDIAFSDESPTSNAVKAATYYTADPSSALQQIQISINALKVEYPSVRTEDWATEASPRLSTFSFNAPLVCHSLKVLQT